MSSKQSNFVFGSNCCFSVCFVKPKKTFFGLFQCGIETTETNRKSSKQRSLLGYPQNNKFFFRFEPKPGCFSVVFFFSRNPPKIFSVCFGVSDQYWNNQNKQNLWYGELKGLYFNKFPVVSVGLLFVSVVSKHQNSLFRYWSETTETNVLFRIVPKLVSVVSIRN